MPSPASWRPVSSPSAAQKRCCRLARAGVRFQSFIVATTNTRPPASAIQHFDFWIQHFVCLVSTVGLKCCSCQIVLMFFNPNYWLVQSKCWQVIISWVLVDFIDRFVNHFPIGIPDCLVVFASWSLCLLPPKLHDVLTPRMVSPWASLSHLLIPSAKRLF